MGRGFNSERLPRRTLAADTGGLRPPMRPPSERGAAGEVLSIFTSTAYFDINNPIHAAASFTWSLIFNRGEDDIVPRSKPGEQSKAGERAANIVHQSRRHVGLSYIFSDVINRLLCVYLINPYSSAAGTLPPGGAKSSPGYVIRIHDCVDVGVPIARPALDFYDESASKHILFPCYTLPQSAKGGDERVDPLI
jgi:hypothetical protein